MEVPALGATAAKMREQIRGHDDGESEPIDAVTAFVVYITPEGRYIMDTNLDVPLTTERPATRQEVIAACTNVANDITMQMQTELLTMNILGNLSRMQADPQYHIMIAQARAQAEAAAAVAAGAG